MLNNYDTIIFDMDGVIADTEAFHVLAEKQTCIDYGFDINANDWQGFKGKKAEDIFEYLIANFGDRNIHKVEDLISHKTNTFINVTKDIEISISGVKDFLEWSRANFSKIGLVTSSNISTQQYITSKLGITNIFDVIITGDDVKNGKPNPEPYLLAISRLEAIPNKTLVIEDSINGIISAKSSSCHVAAITTSHSKDQLLTQEPNFIFDKYEIFKEQLSKSNF